ncbi:MAG: hypothetical protein ACI9RI_000637 [Oceanospirillaceae bacterium]
MAPKQQIATRENHIVSVIFFLCRLQYQMLR